MMRSKLFQPFEIEVKPAALEKNINFCRILFGLGLTHHYVDILGFTVLANDPDKLALKITIAAGLSLMIAIGLLTPLAIMGMLILFFTFPPLAPNLGYQIAIIVAWGLFLLGAGQSYSIDALLSKVKGLKRVIHWLYLYAVELTPANVAQARFFIIFLYWGICVGAVGAHFLDPLWLRGEVLQLVLVTPYLTDYYKLFTTFRDATPILYDFIWTTALFIQVLWELLLLPLMYFRWGRVFIIIQGLLFFVFSLFFLNLGYLPFFELCWWLLLFNYSAVLGLNRITNFFKDKPVIRSVTLGSNRLSYIFFSSVIILGCFITVTHGIINLNILLNSDSVQWQSWQTNQAWRTAYRLFGQEGVNVFNESDLGMGSVHFILYEAHPGDKTPIRIVPFMDIEGGRLDYLRNDYLYFSHSLPWQRSPIGRKFENKQVANISETTRNLIDKVAKLDTCVTGANTPRFYIAKVFVRSIVSEPQFKIWTPATHIEDVYLTVNDQNLESSYWCKRTFDLPPGQFNTGTREAETRVRLMEYEEESLWRN